jgi:hypothetical protein
MNPAGCKSDQSNQLFSLEIWKPPPGSSIRTGCRTWFAAENASALIKALEKEASVEA